jgi:Mrp family chromosome partitioning ATPase
MNIAKDRVPISEEGNSHGEASGYAKSSEVSQPRSTRDVPRNGVEPGGFAEFSPRMIPELSRDQLKLRNNLLLARERQGVRAVLVTGTSEGVGVTAVATTLALGLSLDHKKRVLLIDANAKRPKLHKLFDLKSSLEMATEDMIGFFDIAVVNGIPNLRVIPIDGLPAGAAFDIKRFVAVLPALREAFDFMIIDAPPLTLNFDVLMLSLHLDGVMVVAEADRTRTEEIQEVMKELRRAGMNSLGLVLNRLREDLPGVLKSWL